MDSGILQNIRVLDLTRYVSGPYCGVLLADMGAEVIKVEKPDTGEVSRTVAPYFGGVSLFFPPYNRSKKSVTANLRTPEGIATSSWIISGPAPWKKWAWAMRPSGPSTPGSLQFPSPALDRGAPCGTGWPSTALSPPSPG